jgi:site-specific DNA recombinase
MKMWRGDKRMNHNVMVIPAHSPISKAASTEAKLKLRVAAYCRVSTDSDEQASSYEVQIEHYTAYINNNPEWTLAGIFADDGISGTNTKKRDEFNRMITECMAGRIDMVITKSISRFARNTLDCLKFIRMLKDKNIAVFFEKENIDTLDTKGEILLTIMASLAQQESQSLSQNVKLGIQYRYQQGEIQINHNRFLGYTKDENKRLVIDLEDAVVVKRIYREYLEGRSLQQIGNGLEADGILTAAGNFKWRPNTIMKILKNEKYIGDALLQKTYTVDFLTKKRVVNNGIVPQYYVENCHEAIIPKGLFLQVQEELARRVNLKSGEEGNKRLYSAKNALAGIVFCGECGEIYRRVHWNNRGCRSIVWRCVSRLEGKGSGCSSSTISEETLQRSIVRAINQVITGRHAFLEVLRQNISEVLNEQQDIGIGGINSRLEELQKELLRLAASRGEYMAVADEILQLRDRKQAIMVQEADRLSKLQTLQEMAEFLDGQTGILMKYEERLARRLVERVTVLAGRVLVGFRSGVEVGVGM